MKIAHRGIARSHDVEFLEIKVLGIVYDGLLRITDVNNPTSVADEIDCLGKGLGEPDRLKNHVGAVAAGPFLNDGKHILRGWIDCPLCAERSSDRALLGADLDCEHLGASAYRTNNRPHSDHSAADHNDPVARLDTAARHSVEADRKGLYQRQAPGRERIVHNQLGGRKDNLLGESAVLLDAEGLVVAASVQPALSAGRAPTAIGVGHDDHPRARLEPIIHTGAGFDNLATYFVTGDARQFHEWIEAPEGVEITTA